VEVEQGLSLFCARMSIAIFLFAFLTRLILIVHLQQYKELDRPEAIRVAISLSEKGTFANPFPTPTGPTAHVAPLYPMLLSVIFRIFGTGTEGEFVKQMLTCAAAALQYALLPLVAAAWGINPRIGVLAGIIGGSFSLAHIWYDLETKGNFELLFTSLSLILLCLFTARSLKAEHQKITDGILTGVASGFILLLAPNIVLVMLGFAAFQIYRSRRLRVAVTAIICAALMLVPWTWRNYRIFGHLFFVRDNFGLELSVSNSDSVWAEYNREPDQTVRRHPFGNVQEAIRLRTEGERNYYQERLHEALSWIESHPDRFARLALSHIWHYWFSLERPLGGAERAWVILVKSVLLWSICLTGFLGIALAIRRRRDAGIPLAIIVVVYPLTYYVIEFDERYPYPVRWCLLLAACYAVAVAVCGNSILSSAET
jgi:hypothetical protein